MVSARIKEVSPSLTLGITAQVKKMENEGIRVIGFTAGEPDFDTPENIKEKAKESIDKGFTKYTPSSGIRELKEAICEKFKRDNHLEYRPEEIIVSCGAKQAIFNALFTLCDEGDEVILPSPYWLSYPEMIKLVGGKAVIIKTGSENNFKITPQDLEKAITKRTCLLILNSPANPTGMVYQKEELAEIAEILIQHKLWCISDEIYEKLIYDDREHVSIASLGKEIKERTLVVNGVSKTYAMTGWRIGYCAGPKEVIQAMSNLQDHTTSNPTSISQMAALEALTGNQETLKRMRDEFKERRDYMVEVINSLPYLKTLKPQGAFYCWVDISGALGKIMENKKIENSLAFTEALLQSVYVAVIPGEPFGDEKHIRLSYATGREKIKEGLARIEKFLLGLRLTK
ncbi:MAG: pyridoxal phosphate-dependent aminotransferase [Candidatus Omnitrophica bacterium]|nr:pyridoxal phosphate-dependent aminotransferase [Candidatus Omnitrophota bacterium]MCM8798531.1 pyridoxal phosphate-dependent aminotransferase [Candidatus Omnitrophota bacterium]